jgi:hypothetical protein
LKTEEKQKKRKKGAQIVQASKYVRAHREKS